MKRDNLVVTLILFFISFSAVAQEVRIRGVVTEATGEPVIGVSMVVKGTTNSTLTNYNGEFSQLLRNSEFKGRSTYKDVLNLAQANIGTDTHGYRTEFIQMVKKVEKLPKPKTKKKGEKPVKPVLYGATQFDSYDFDPFYEMVVGEQKTGMKNENEKIIVPAEYDDIEIEEYDGFIIVEKNDTYGLYDLTGRKLSDVIYDDEPDSFANGYFLVSKDEREGLIDSKGKVIIPCKYEDIDDLTPNVFVVETEKDKMGAYSGNGKRILKDVYDDIDLLDVPREFKNYEYLELEKNDRYGVASAKGEIIVSCKYDDINVIEYKENGVVTDIFFLVEKNDKYGLISKTGKVIIPVRYDDWDLDFENGLLEAEKGDKTYYFNRYGKLIRKL